MLLVVEYSSHLQLRSKHFTIRLHLDLLIQACILKITDYLLIVFCCIHEKIKAKVYLYGMVEGIVSHKSGCITTSVLFAISVCVCVCVCVCV